MAMEQARQTRKMVETVDEKLDAHLKEQGIHWTPDSERIINRLDSGVNALNSIFLTMKDDIAALRAGNHKRN